MTLFNRGKTNPGLFPDLETIIGDRDGGLAGLARRRWDAVVDTSGYLPRLVGDSARALVDAVERYLFISTISVYRIPGSRRDRRVRTAGDAAEPGHGERRW